jgi:GAF domain-containing protein/CheY-like chemotaxis protein
MKTLLVLAKQPELAAAMSAALDQDQYRVLLREQVRDAESLLCQGFIDACVIEADLTNIQPIRTLEQLHRLVPRCPILVYASGRQWEWEEDAYLLGATYILSKPVRAQLLNALLDRLWAPGETAKAINPARPIPAEPVRPVWFKDSWQTLAVLRNFSGILSNSLCSEALLKQFLLFLREILAVNRAAIFLRPPLCSLNLGGAASEDRRLRSACAIGLASGLLDHLTLSLEAGIGGYVYRQGRILRIGSEESNRDREIHKEFEILGVQVAIPILDRESLVGVAVFDGRLTGEPFANDELTLVFHLLEQLGLAIRNSWLHDELVTSHEMMADILNQLGSSCLVISQKMDVIHSNRAARSMFGPNPDSVAPLEFCDLPIVLSSKIFEALRNGQGMPPFFYQPSDHPERTYRVTISPFYRRNFNTANAVLLVVEDYTQQQHSQELEIESANLRLGATMAEHLRMRLAIPWCLSRPTNSCSPRELIIRNSAPR